MDIQIPAWGKELVLSNKKKRKYLVNFAISADPKLKMKENKTIKKDT